MVGEHVKMFSFRWACVFFTTSFLDNAAEVKEFFLLSEEEKK